MASKEEKSSILHIVLNNGKDYNVSLSRENAVSILRAYHKKLFMFGSLMIGLKNYNGRVMVIRLSHISCMYLNEEREE